MPTMIGHYPAYLRVGIFYAARYKIDAEPLFARSVDMSLGKRYIGLHYRDGTFKVKAIASRYMVEDAKDHIKIINRVSDTGLVKMEVLEVAEEVCMCPCHGICDH